jgi:hypothetical protein
MNYNHYFPKESTEHHYYNPLFKTLLQINDLIEDESLNALYCDYLIKKAKTCVERELITRIRDDEIKHRHILSKIYPYYMIEEAIIPQMTNLSGFDVKSAKSNKLNSIIKYHDLYASLTDKCMKDFVFEILIDEQNHVHYYDYLLSIKEDLDTTNTRSNYNNRKTFTTPEAQDIANQLGIDFTKEQFDLEQFRMGLDVELEHGTISPLTNVTNDDPIMTGKIALAHLREFPDYYTRLSRLEKEAKIDWNN